MDPNEEATMFEDITNLEQRLKDDISGDRARILIEYFKDVATASESLLTSASTQEETQQITTLLHGFHAAQRIVQSVWESLHSSALVL